MKSVFQSRNTSTIDKTKPIPRPSRASQPQIQIEKPISVNTHRERIVSIRQQQNVSKYSESINQWRKKIKGPIVGLKSCRIKLMQTDEGQTYLPTVTEPEQISIRLNKIMKIPLKQALYILESLIQGYQQIFQFLGFISFSLASCGINQLGKIKVWINSDLNSNIPEGEIIKEETKCVLELINAVKIISDKKFEDFFQYYIRNARKNKCGFKFTLGLLKSYTKCIRLKLPSELNLYLTHEEPLEGINSTRRGQFNFKTQPNEKIDLREDLSQTCNLTAKRKSIYEKSIQRKKISKVASLKTLSKYPQKDTKRSMKKEKKPIRSKTPSGQCFFPKNQKKEKKHISTKKHPSLIINQFSFAFNPRNTVGECETTIKESEISTTQKTNSNKMKESGQTDWVFPQINDKKLTHKSQNIMKLEGSRERKQRQKQKGEKVFKLLSFMPEKLEEVESRGQCSEIQDIEIKKKSSDGSLKRQKINAEIISKNNWINQIDDLFVNARPTLNSSRIEGAEPEPVFHCSTTEKLDKWARMISQSVISEQL